ncbi:NEW3 domain-containing protein [Ectothiorhodospira lacustris]|uniref:NEW3 domain-containing protein n=1 Tax=Ectothiorhodospira lacustris TaxID=2899127 RepID=UPI001EE7A825|nr:NEW3 domain-containing protein [Ectothiorhodospira lacustris]MCG5502203.1 NEW3 domain-containing protein [Ectothiorhodospira lacustris]
MKLLIFLLGVGLVALPVASRLLSLAPSRGGWVMYLANVVLETLEKRLPFSRWWAEGGLIVFGCVLLFLGSGMAWLAWLVVVLHLLLVLQNQLRERAVVNAVYADQEWVGLRGATSDRPGYPAPGLHPWLSLNVEGPFVARWPELDLGLLLAGTEVNLALLVGNHSRVPTQTPVNVMLDVPEGWLVRSEATLELPVMQSGEVQRVAWTLRPSEGGGPGRVGVRVLASRFERSLSIHHAGCRQVDSDMIESVSVTRYPGGRCSAFSWRGDMDLYDSASFQDIQGLKAALELGRRYGIAQTLFLSTRLSLSEQDAREWADRYGVNRGAEEIPRFVDWLRENVSLCYSCPYPAQSPKPYLMELGNHGHLHYDTDTAGAPGNQWKAGARPGEGRYPWTGEDGSSFGDQRENIREAMRWCERLLGFVPRSWAKPGRGNDRFTPSAVEAAGCEVATGSDIRIRDNVLRQPRPHHPAGTRIVELTARYPSDPQHIQHVAMLQFWMHRAHRLGIPMVMLVHQHMRQFDGIACARFTEYLVRYALERFNGDLYIDTVYGIGVWWRDVLNEETRRVDVVQEEGRIRVANHTDRDMTDLPLDLRLKGGACTTWLVSVPAGGEVVLVPGNVGS